MRRALRGFPRVVWLLGLASLLNDVSSEPREASNPGATFGGADPSEASGADPSEASGADPPAASRTGLAPPARPGAAAASTRRLPSAFWYYLALATLFALGNSTDAFLILKARAVGFSAAAVPLFWFAHHLVKTAAGVPGGALSDRVPRGAVVAAGWGAYALAYAGFALAAERWQVAALFLFYALYRGLAEGAERALVADLAGPGARGRAFGWYHGVIGAAALPAGLLTGELWTRVGPAVALGTCAALAASAALLLAVNPRVLRGAR